MDREAIAKQLYTDWNRYDEDGEGEFVTEKLLLHWNDLPEESKQVYRDWINKYVPQVIAFIDFDKKEVSWL